MPDPMCSAAVLGSFLDWWFPRTPMLQLYREKFCHRVHIGLPLQLLVRRYQMHTRIFGFTHSCKKDDECVPVAYILVVITVADEFLLLRNQNRLCYIMQFQSILLELYIVYRHTLQVYLHILSIIIYHSSISRSSNYLLVYLVVML